MRAIRDLPLLKFKLAIIFLLLIGDICGGMYFYSKWVNYENFLKIFDDHLALQGMSSDSIPEVDKEMAYNFLASFISVFIVGFLLFHIVLHIFFYRGAKIVWSYYKPYSLLAAVCCGVGIFVDFNIFFLIAFLAYTLGTIAFFSRPYEGPPPKL